jgi:alpha-glucosidase
MGAKFTEAAVGLRGWRTEREGIASFELDDAVAEISMAADGSVRLRAARGSGLPEEIDSAIGRDPWQPTRLDARDRPGGGAVIEGGQRAVRVEVDAQPFAMRAIDRAGVVGELGGVAFSADGSSRIELAAGPEEHFFGFGEKPGGLDKRGELLRMRNRDPGGRSFRDPLYLSIPFLLALDHAPGGARARGAFFDSLAPSRFDVAASRSDRIAVETDAGGIDATLFPGPLPRDVLRRFTARVGRNPLPPLWALGHHQSRWSYASEAEVRSVAAQIRAHRIPTDVIHLDIDYMDGFRVFTWHPKRFPDPRQLIAELSAQGFRVVVIVDPGVKSDPGYAVFREGTERDLFCKKDDGSPFTVMVWPRHAALPDFNRSEVRKWWGEQHRELLEADVAGIWNDMNEPAGWSGEIRLGRLIFPYRKQNLSRVVQSHPSDPERTVPHEQVRNAYGLQHCRATRSYLESANPGKRAFLLTRSGYAGIQRFAAVWTGDNSSRWSHLRESIPMLLNLSISGVPFCGADIGGFAFSCTPELYARWIQLGSLYPFARTHSMWLKRRQEPWRFGRRVESIARGALELRMRLLPYLYGLFREAEESGAPVWRPLFYEFPEDPEAAAIEDQLMVGPSLLVAPVVEEGGVEREIYLPSGIWTSWDDGARFVGPRRLRVAAPLERLPLFARGGSVIHTQSAVSHVGEAPEEPCVLQVFPGADASAELVEDDGESTAYREGVVARTRLRLWDRAGGRLRLELGRREGSFPLAARPVRVVIHGCPAPELVLLDGIGLAAREAVPGYGAREGAVQIRFVDAGEGHVIEVAPAP